MGLADKSGAQEAVPWFSTVQPKWEVTTLIISNEFVDLSVLGSRKMPSLGNGSSSASESWVFGVTDWSWYSDLLRWLLPVTCAVHPQQNRQQSPRTASLPQLLKIASTTESSLDNRTMFLWIIWLYATVNSVICTGRGSSSELAHSEVRTSPGYSSTWTLTSSQLINSYKVKLTSFSVSFWHMVEGPLSRLLCVHSVLPPSKQKPKAELELGCSVKHRGLKIHFI